ncbi:hypothetical protein EDD15DRAFT_2245489 [Pisolithus albus]|nr:hypothetical protein EDD15DRAFT_2245489 [Pisolithus albus]
MVASRYIVMQTGRDAEDPDRVYQGKAVSIHRNDFDLTDRTKAIEFIREMYNLVGEVNNLVMDLDGDKAETLPRVVAAAKEVLSLHSKDYPVSRDPVNDLGIFGANDVQEQLQALNYAIDSRVDGVCLSLPYIQRRWLTHCSTRTSLLSNLRSMIVLVTSSSSNLHGSRRLIFWSFSAVFSLR